jgi:hypothetical protein
LERSPCGNRWMRSTWPNSTSPLGFRSIASIVDTLQQQLSERYMWISHSSASDTSFASYSCRSRDRRPRPDKLLQMAASFEVAMPFDLDLTSTSPRPTQVSSQKCPIYFFTSRSSLFVASGQTYAPFRKISHRLRHPRSAVIGRSGRHAQRRRCKSVRTLTRWHHQPERHI